MICKKARHCRIERIIKFGDPINNKNCRRRILRLERPKIEEEKRIFSKRRYWIRSSGANEFSLRNRINSIGHLISLYRKEASDGSPPAGPGVKQYAESRFRRTFFSRNVAPSIPPSNETRISRRGRATPSPFSISERASLAWPLSSSQHPPARPVREWASRATDPRTNWSRDPRIFTNSNWAGSNRNGAGRGRIYLAARCFHFRLRSLILV
jgi:hypothetical protein